MALQMTPKQMAFMSNPDRVLQLAAWAVGTSNSYAQRLRAQLAIPPQSSGATSTAVTAMRDYLTDGEADKGIVIRLLNAYLQTPNV